MGSKRRVAPRNHGICFMFLVFVGVTHTRTIFSTARIAPITPGTGKKQADAHRKKKPTIVTRKPTRLSLVQRRMYNPFDDNSPRTFVHLISFRSNAANSARTHRFRIPSLLVLEFHRVHRYPAPQDTPSPTTSTSATTAFPFPPREPAACSPSP